MKNQSGNEGLTSALYIWNGLTAFWGTSFYTDPHCHGSLQLVFDISNSFKIKDKSSSWVFYSTAIIRTSHIHQLDSNGSMQLFIYLDEETEYARKLNNKYLVSQNISSLDNDANPNINREFVKKLLVETDCEKLFQGLLTIIEELVGADSSKNNDIRISRAINYIEKTHKPIKVKDVGEHVCLSESRLRFLFKQEVGQSIQSFILWTKVIRSINPILKGNQISQSAYSAGFWDPSHLNRSFKKLLGISPREIRKYEKGLKIIACNKSNLYTFRTDILNDWESVKSYRTIKL